MMKSIVICEGQTDAILLSYYLSKVNGWEFHRGKDKRKNMIPIRNHHTEETNWYVRGEDVLAIWGVGGESNFQYAIEQILQINRLANREDVFSKIIVVRDRDNFEKDQELLARLGGYLQMVDLQNNEWKENIYINELEEAVHVKILTLIIPLDQQGALETFILEAIREMGEEENCIVNNSKGYVASFNLTNYLYNQRLKIKGELAVTLATLYPQKTFTPIDAMLKNINWEDYKTIQKGFRRLEEI